MTDEEQRRTSQLAVTGLLAPTSSGGQVVTSVFPAPDDPEVAVDVLRGDLGLDDGRGQSIFTVDRSKVDTGELTRVARAEPGARRGDHPGRRHRASASTACATGCRCRSATTPHRCGCWSSRSSAGRAVLSLASAGAGSGYGSPRRRAGGRRSWSSAGSPAPTARVTARSSTASPQPCWHGSRRTGADRPAWTAESEDGGPPVNDVGSPSTATGCSWRRSGSTCSRWCSMPPSTPRSRSAQPTAAPAVAVAVGGDDRGRRPSTRRHGPSARTCPTRVPLVRAPRADRLGGAAVNLVVLGGAAAARVDRHPRAGGRPLAAGQHVRVHLAVCLAAVVTWLVVLRRLPALRAVGTVRAAPGGDPAVPGRHGALRAGRAGGAGAALVLAGRARHHDHRVVRAAAGPGRRQPALPAAPVRAGAAALVDRAAVGRALDRLAYRTTIVAFPLYTFAVIAGAIWAEAAWGRFWGWDPKETVAFVAWVVYAAYLHARATAGWRTGRAAWINVAGLAVDAVQPVLHQHGGRGPALLRRHLSGCAVPSLAVRDHRPPASPSTPGTTRLPSDSVGDSVLTRG